MKPKRDHHRPSLPHARTAQQVPGPSQECDMDNVIVEELTSRLPTSDLVKIIKGALDRGKENRPFTESDLLRAMTFGSSSTKATPRAKTPASPRRR